MKMIWSRDVLATHSLTGKVSNAHKNKVAKACLDQAKVTALFGKYVFISEYGMGFSLKFLTFKDASF